MNLAIIVQNGKGRAGHWRICPARHPDDGPEMCALWHYGTCMLVWRRDDKRIVYLSTGWGSVSDQNGLNVAFKVLGGWYERGSTLPVPGAPGPAFYYSRAGGARFVILDGRYSLHPYRAGGFGLVLTEAG